MPDTSGASSPEANQSTVRKILCGGSWSFGTLNQTKSNSTVTRAVNPQALFTPSEQVKQLPLVIQYALPIVSIASGQSVAFGPLFNQFSLEFFLTRVQGLCTRSPHTVRAPDQLKVSVASLSCYLVQRPTTTNLILAANCVESCFDWIYSGIKMVSMIWLTVVVVKISSVTFIALFSVGIV
ncbi:hypothetical protein BY996DRAFT_6410099 [Phakopsora pachyrhizi]|nr:hypothetical protein BY996DRAFT_6410099 [Phakopsora pachyrhizi]